MANRMLPILFSTPMVQAILSDHKGVTRRVVKPQPVMDESGMWQWKDCQWMDGGIGFPTSGIKDHARYQPGDVLWVREAWSPVFVRPRRYLYRADAERGCGEGAGLPVKWRPSIHMPREAARLFLRVNDVRVERVQDMTGRDAVKEGIAMFPADSKTDERFYFKELWDSLNAKRGYGWDVNPWVWVIEFERTKKQ